MHILYNYVSIVGKVSGPDSVYNEYIKLSSSPVYVKLFNRILSSGSLSESWLSGTIIPIYKKGDIKQPENYRPKTSPLHSLSSGSMP